MPKKVTSYLKGLVETRARAAGDLERYQRILTEVSKKVAIAQAEVDACDRLIRKYDARLDPTSIKPVCSQQYGGRGNFRAAILSHLHAAYPQCVTTSELALALQAMFGFDFATAAQRDRWVRGSLARALRGLVQEGYVDRLHPPGNLSGEVGRWQLRSASGPSADHLLEQLAASGQPIDSPERISDLDTCPSQVDSGGSD